MEHKIFKKLSTPEQIAKRQRVSIFTIYRWIKSGKLKAVKLHARHFFIEEKDLKKFLKKHNK